MTSDEADALMVNTDGKNGGWTGAYQGGNMKSFKQFMTGSINADELAGGASVRQSGEVVEYIVRERSLRQRHVESRQSVVERLSL